MIALGKPYVSDFLFWTIQKNHFPVISTPEARELAGTRSLNWISEAEAGQRLKAFPENRIYTNSENTLGWLEKQVNSNSLTTQIKQFKNKLKFREMLVDLYPDYTFSSHRLEDLNKLDTRQFTFPLVIKPAVGFFSIAVHRVEDPGEWKQVVAQIHREVESWKGTYPSQVIDTTEFILEDCIEGEEYAIDCYFDPYGQPVILNILHHAFSSGKDVSDRVYTTSEQIIREHLPPVSEFMQKMGNKAGLAGFPLHAEVRMDKDGKIIPIEVNPLRFGGWCTTGDLSWYGLGINSYEFFFNSRQPDWEQVFANRGGKKYSVVVLDNNSGFPASQIQSVDYERLRKDFENVLELRKVDFRRYGVFGFLFLETSEGNEQELTRILNSDLSVYIRTA
jgi:hypothetical protein